MNLIQFHKHLRSVSPHRHIHIRALDAAIGHLNVVAGNRHITDAIIRGDLCNNSSSFYTYTKIGLKTLEGGIVKERSEDSQIFIQVATLTTCVFRFKTALSLNSRSLHYEYSVLLRSIMT